MTPLAYAILPGSRPGPDVVYAYSMFIIHYKSKHRNKYDLVYGLMYIIKISNIIFIFYLQ